MEWAKAIRECAKRRKIGVEELRRESGLGGGTFYEILRGEPPKTTRVIGKLVKAGVKAPRLS